MVSEYCVIGSTFGTRSANSGCNYGCYKDKFVLKDRMNEEFLVKTDRYCRSHIYNPIPVNLVPFIKELKKNNITNYRIDFIDEEMEETENILKYIFTKEDVNLGRTTKGHYKRGIEQKVGENMNAKTFRVLEYDKVKEILKKYTATKAGKDIIDRLQPYNNLYEIRAVSYTHLDVYKRQR